MDDLTPAVAAPSAMEEFRRTWNLVPGHFMQYQCHERHARELDELRKRVAEGQGEVALRCAEIARTACAMLRSDYSAYRQPLEARILHVIHETAGMRAAEAIRAYATTLPADEGSEVKRLQEMVWRANDILRSCFQVSERMATVHGTEAFGTNWGALHEQINKALNEQFQIANKARSDEGSVRVPVQLLRDMQSNAAIGEPEWSSIEEHLLRLVAAKGRT